LKDIKTHKRVLDTFTGPVERPALHWLSAHMPAWVTPDILTGVGFLGAVLIAVAYWLTNLNPNFLWLASLGFVINWFGDSLDGSLARYRKIERPIYGFYIDHTVDTFCEVLVFLGLGLSPYVRFDLASLALIGYLLLSVQVYIRTCVKSEFVISYIGLGPTEARIIAVGANTLVYFVGNPTLTFLRLTGTVYDFIVVVIIILLFSINFVTAIKQARIMAKADA
jgi:phosphatidylglycerophosphate synthase